jgi:hypothetical protein
MWDRDGKIICRIVSHSHVKLAEDKKQSIYIIDVLFICLGHKSNLNITFTISVHNSQ